MIQNNTIAPDCRAKARGLLKRSQSFSEIFQLAAMQEIARLLEKNSKNLQSSSLTAENALDGINKMYIRLTELRSHEEFHRLYSEVDNRCPELVRADPAAKRKRTNPQYMSDFTVHSRAPMSSSHISNIDNV